MYYIIFDDYVKLMRILMILTIPLILSMSMLFGLGSANLDAIGQQDNQTQSQTNQTQSQTNITQSLQKLDPQATNQLLGYVDAAIRGMNEGNDTAVTSSLELLKGDLVNASKASDESVVVVPPKIVSENVDDETETN